MALTYMPVPLPVAPPVSSYWPWVARRRFIRRRQIVNGGGCVVHTRGVTVTMWTRIDPDFKRRIEEEDDEFILLMLLMDE